MTQLERPTGPAGHYKTMVALASQPRMNCAAARLLVPRYQAGAVLLDLWGTLGEDGYWVEHVTLSGSAIEVTDLFADEALEDLSRWCDLNGPSTAELRAEQDFEEKIDAIAEARAARAVRPFTVV